MCLAIPARVISIDGQEADVEIGGIGRRISILLVPEVVTGDYVLVHTGYAIGLVDREEAEKTLRMFREISVLEEESN